MSEDNRDEGNKVKNKMTEEIRKLKDIIYRLEYHFDQYRDYKYKSTNASRKPDREKARTSMISSAGYLENVLLEWPSYGIIKKNGDQFQFEDFWRYVESDLPDYLSALKTHLEKLEINESKK